MAKPKVIFLTGVTGTLGKEMVKTLLTTTDSKLYLLIRRKGRYSHWDRARKVLATAGLEVHLGTRVQVLEGDVTFANMGLRPDEILTLRNEAQEFFHIAALTTLNGSEEECSRINIGGVANALDLAWDLRKNGKLDRFFYYSTAYVAGSLQNYVSMEDGLPSEPAHANFYESSKYSAEKKVRGALMEGLPITIFRPSIVVGNSKTGEVSEFNVIYPFMKLFAHGILNILPSRPENAFNIVPIDYVINASLVISRQKDSLGKTFHLVSEQPPKIGMILKLKDELYPEMPHIALVEPDEFKKEKLDAFTQTVFQMLEPYLGYLNGNLTFDTRNTRQALEGTGIDAPKTDYDFLKTLIHYAIDAGYLVLNRQRQVQ
jgi:thioester reductase-like protein